MNLLTPTKRASQGRAANDGRLKVWSIITSLTSGGAESLIASLNPCFIQEGIDHTVIALCDAATVGNSPETEQRLARQIRLAGGAFASLKLNRWREPLSGSRALNRLMKNGMPDLIHAHTARAIPSVSASTFKGSVVLTHHNSRLSFPRAFFRYLDAVVDGYVAISAETEQIYASNCKKPATRISNGVGSSFFSDAVRQASDRPCKIVSVGAISEQKNYGLLLETARELQTRSPDEPIASFKIAGAGKGLSQLRRQVESDGLQGTVECLGERSDIPDLLFEADMFLNTSNYEGQSVAILEAMAMALPVVATDVPGNQDLISHEKNGLLATHNDPHELANAIVRLIDNPHLYASLSEGAKATGLEYSAVKTATEHIELYRRLASKG